MREVTSFLYVYAYICSNIRDTLLIQKIMDEKNEIKEAKRLHVSNIPFRFRDPDLRQMFGVCSFKFSIISQFY